MPSIIPRQTLRPPNLSHLRSLISQHFATSHYSTVNVPSLTKIIPYKHRSQALKQAQELLTDYLHNTRALPFTYAETISKNSAHSLCEVVSKVPFSSSAFARNFQRFLRYNPINEFGFFFESIGIDYAHVGLLLKPNVHFFDDDYDVFEVACCLAEFGFPWGMLGRLYVGEASVFGMKAEVLRGRLEGLVSLGFTNQQVIGICLSFPCLLRGENVQLSGEFDGLLDDLKRVFVDFDFGSSVSRNVDGWFEVGRKVRAFYELGVKKGEVGELLVKGRSILTDFPEEVLVEKIEFFSRLGVENAEVGLLILSNPEILSIKLVDRVISVSSVLEHFGIREKKMKSVQQNYKYVFGRNKMVNLPNILRAMNLHKWFFHRMKCGYHKWFADYALSGPDDGVDEKYHRSLESVKSLRTFSYSYSKLDFFHEIGFGENGFTVKLLAAAHGSPSDLQERFNFLLNQGIEYSQLCKMLSRAPKFLNQENDSFKKKIDFFRDEIGLPLDYMEVFPSYLLYNLEKRIKPRYKFHEWLIEQGLSAKRFTLASIVSVSHKSFMTQLSGIHPDAPRLWLERYGDKKTD
ncbi:hypothetical protein vseg_009234 [Gypsophila vaccaria]